MRGKGWYELQRPLTAKYKVTVRANFLSEDLVAEYDVG